MALISTTSIYPEDHAMGAVCSVSDCTDFTNRERRDECEIVLIKYNGGATVFHSFVNPTANSVNLILDFKAMDQFGVLDFQMYHRTFLMNDVDDPAGIFRNIPDWEKTEHTEYGERKFANVTDGDSKDAQTPNHGQEMYDASNGELGYDSVLGWGASNGKEIKELLKYEKAFIEEYKSGRSCVAFSYGFGRNETPKVREPYFILGRNSLTDGFTNYGTSKKPGGASLGVGTTVLTHAGMVDLPMTLRDIALGATFTSSNAKTLEAVTNNGWYKHFTHWQNIGTIANYEGMISGMATQIGSNFVFFASLANVGAYKLLRDGFVSGTIKDYETYMDIEVVLSLEATINPMYLIQPLSFQIDLTGTSFEGANITSNEVVRIFDEGSNVYTIDIDFRNYPTGRRVRLVTTGSPSYTSKLKPTISNISVVGDLLVFNTDIPCKSSLFYTPRSNAYYNGADLICRDNDLKVNHSYDLSDTDIINQIKSGITSTNVFDNDLYIAVTSEIGQSNLSAAQQINP